MKKSKLLIPLLTIAGSAAIVAPIMTSCTTGETEETHFTFDEEESSEKSTSVDRTEAAGMLTYVYACTDSTLTKEQVDLIEPVAVISSANSNISLLKCWKQSYDLEAKTITICLSYSINPDAFEYKETEGKEVDPEKLVFGIKIHNGTWTQTDENFSLIAKRDAKPE